MRIGEVLALRIDDLDFERNLIYVRPSVFAGTLGTPKSEASMAPLPMPLDLAHRLKVFLSSKHYRQNSQGLLFASRRGRPFSANKLREKKLHPLLASLGIPLAGFHAFRHGVATTLIDRGAKHHNRRRSTTTQLSKDHSRAVCARRSSIAKRRC